MIIILLPLVNVKDRVLNYRGVCRAFCEKHQSRGNHVDLFIDVFICDVSFCCCHVVAMLSAMSDNVGVRCIVCHLIKVRLINHLVDLD